MRFDLEGNIVFEKSLYETRMSDFVETANIEEESFFSLLFLVN